MGLAELREELDRVDRELVKLYRERMSLVSEVAKEKRRSGKAVLDPVREEEKLDSVSAFLKTELREKLPGEGIQREEGTEKEPKRAAVPGKETQGEESGRGVPPGGESEEDSRRAGVDTEFHERAVRELFRQLMSLSRRWQQRLLLGREPSPASGFREVSEIPRKKKRVAYQGLPGAYAELAARKSFPDDCRFLPSESFRSTVESVLSGEADFAVLPIENSSYGAVADNFDLLLQFPEAVILGECFLPVEHVLMALPGGTLSGIRRVFSHPQALAQCESFFRKHPRIEAVPARNTAEAARRVRESGDRELAALASENAAEIYGLSILQRAVNQQKSNTTRFLIVGKEKIYERGAERLSLSFELSHRPGALYHVLGSFLFNDLNLSMIQSRPVPDRPFEYRFFVDVMGNLSDPDVRNALSELPGFRILGNYSDFSDAFPRKAAFPAERIKGGI